MSERQVKKIVKSKLKVLPQLMTIFNNNLQAEENFTKGMVCCSFATSDGSLTIGFSKGKLSRPKTLLNKNFLSHGKAIYKIEKISRLNYKLKNKYLSIAQQEQKNQKTQNNVKNYYKSL